jgi:hypothetical protein
MMPLQLCRNQLYASEKGRASKGCLTLLAKLVYTRKVAASGG